MNHYTTTIKAAFYGDEPTRQEKREPRKVK
jgi:hypothetical protein